MIIHQQDQHQQIRKNYKITQKPLWRKWWMLVIYFSLAISIVLLSWGNEDVSDTGEVTDDNSDITSQVEEVAEERDLDTGHEKDPQTEPEAEVDTEELYLVDVEEGNSLFIRKSPGTKDKPDDDIIDRVPRGRIMKIINKQRNSIVVDNFTWWEVNDSETGITGWAAAEYLLAKDSEVELDRERDTSTSYDPSEPFAENDYYWYVDNVKVDIGLEKQEIIALLGDPQEVTEDEFDNKDMIYPELGLKISLISLYEFTGSEENKGKYKSLSMQTDSPMVTGPRNIKVGDTFNSVLNKFPDEGNSIVVTDDMHQAREQEMYRRLLYGDDFDITQPSGFIYYDNNKNPLRLWLTFYPYLYLTVSFENQIITKISLHLQIT